MDRDKLFLTVPELFKPVVLQEKSGACSQWFKACLELSNLTHDAWLERKSAEFHQWASDLNVGNNTLDSPGVQLRFRPDVVETAVDALNGLAHALSGYHAIATGTVPAHGDGFASDSGADDESVASCEAGEAGSPWTNISDQEEDESSERTSAARRSIMDQFDVPAELRNTGHRASCLEKRAYIENNLSALIRIRLAMTRSGPKFRYELVDMLLRQEERDYQQIKMARGEHHALETKFGEHEKFRRRLTRLMLGTLYSENLMLRLGNHVYELATSTNARKKTTYEVVLLKKVMVVIRACLYDPARLNPVQRRLIDANVVRRNRLAYLVGASTADCVLGELESSDGRGDTFQLVGVTRQGGSTATAPTDASYSPSHTGVLVERRDDKDADAVAMRFATAPEFPVPKSIEPETSFTITGALASTQLTAGLNVGKALEYKSTNASNMPPSIDSLDEGTATAQRWREVRPYIDQETLPYVCIFEDCASPEETFASKYQWMSHIVNSHSDRAWFCPQCPSRSDSTTVITFETLFSERSALQDHISAYHSISDSSELELLVDASQRIISIPETRCPLCPPRCLTWVIWENNFLIPTKGSDFVRLEEDEHIATHLREFALEALRSVAEKPAANTKLLHSYLPSIYAGEFTEPYPVTDLTLTHFKYFWDELPQATRTLSLLSFLADREIPLWLLPDNASLTALSGLRNCAFFQVGRACLRVNSSVRLAVQAWVEKIGQMKTIATALFRHITRKLPRLQRFYVFDESIRDVTPHFSSILDFRSYYDDGDGDALLRVLEFASDAFFYIEDYAKAHQLAGEAVQISEKLDVPVNTRFSDNMDRYERAGRAAKSRRHSE